jgi:putative membrane protein
MRSQHSATDEKPSLALSREPLLLLLIVVACLAASGIAPHDRLTWALEVSWVIAGIPILLATYRRWPLTPMLYRLLAAHALLLIVGGYYTYELVPLGNWVKDWVGGDRNDFDRLGHFVQGFVPAILVREILLRWSPLRPGWWLRVLVVSVCLAFSALFELIEWWAALLLGQAADAFLATQGDIWDTQADMCCALVGAISSLFLLEKLHDRQLFDLVRGIRMVPTTNTD